MAYTALYRKYRPDTFEDVKGQEHIVTSLKNQLGAGRVGHAYLFTGTRGTGKTTVAKILAKAVNCESLIDGSPCGECAMCRAIAAGNSMNVIELDAASNNSVDDIRQIVDEVQYSPAQGKYRVYIIDEVHMLSIGAFNALLKTLEEPPEYVIFILATTEVHKIPITILSRCQRYDFRRMDVGTIAGRLRELSEQEGIKAEEKALLYVAKAADGSMRDALSLYDQCTAFYLGEHLTYDMVLDVLGAVDMDIFHQLFRYILKQDITGIMALLEKILAAGRELSQFILDFTWYLRNLLLLKTSDQASDLVDATAENMAILKDLALQIPADVLILYIRILSELSGQLKYATQKRVLVEITFVKICRPQMNKGEMETVEARLSALEARMEQGFAGMSVQALPPVNGNPQVQEPMQEPLPDAVSEELLAVAGQWRAVLSSLKGGLKSMMGSCHPSAGQGNKLILVFRDKTSQGFVDTPEHLAEIEVAIESMIHKKVQVETKLAVDGQEQNKYPDLLSILQSKISMPVEIED